MKYFDVHTHLNMQFDADWQEAGKRALLADTQFVIVGADLPSSELAIKQAKYFGDNGFATVGLHPTESNGGLASIRELAQDDKVVAIGECGLEYFRIKNDLLAEEEKKRQKELFIKHIELALEVEKPLMIHCRSFINSTDAYDDLYEILKSYKDKVGDKLKFNLHFFTSDWVTAKKFLDLGGYLSFPGVITFTDQYDEVVKNMPLDRIMSETDAPFATPEPFRGQRNEPLYVQYIAERICTLRFEPKEEVLGALVENALRFYNLVDS